MIFVKRVPAPRVLWPSSRKRRDEYRRARDHFANPATAGTSFEFKLYKHDAVAAALRGMFERFCAYCESDYACAGPADIEHFRPKGGFLEHDAGGKATLCKPGYWWLAASWDNLLAACPGCNRQWTQEIRSTDDLTVQELAGKGNWFPLAHGSPRALQRGHEGLEDVLLLNPCKDDPSQHLVFNERGFITATSIGGWASIRTYGLDRDDLCTSRSDHVRSVVNAIALLKDRVHLYNADIGTLQGIREALDEIHQLRKTRYKAVTRMLFEKHLSDLVDTCEKLLMADV